MASLRDIRNRISSVRNTQQVTRAMKMVAAAKLRRSQERIFKARPYAYQISEIIAHLARRFDASTHPLFERRPEGGGVLLIIVTADRGLAGGFNANIIKLAEQTIRERFAAEQQAGRLFLLCIGRKAHEHFSKRGYQLVGDYRGIVDHLSFGKIAQIAGAAVQGFRDHQWDQAYVLYNEFKNTISQNRIVEPLLPVPTERFLTPIMEREAERRGEPAAAPSSIDYIFEPGSEDILEAIVPRYLNMQLWRVLLESAASEQGARMVAMDNATSNADELLRELRLRYNRARQDAITKELIEITSGANALAEA